MKKLCVRCQATEFRRLNRNGFLERKVLPLLGVFPWECALCRDKVYMRADGHRPGSAKRDTRRSRA